jgi:DNA-binding MarR family transcriptional regulator
VAAGLGITPASASLALDRLEAIGYVERRKRTTDRRSVQVVATRSGRGLVSRVRRIVDAKLAETVDRVGVRDTKRFVDLATDMTRALMEDEEFFGDICAQCGSGCSKSCVIHELFEDAPYID